MGPIASFTRIIHDFFMRRAHTESATFAALIILAALAVSLSTNAAIASADTDISAQARAGRTEQRPAPDLCQRFATSPRRLPPSCVPPPPVDACPNVPGNQASGPCADQQCVNQGGTWTGTTCDFPPFVRLTYPNGGETFTVGDVINITWESNKMETCTLGWSNAPGSLNWIDNAPVIPGAQKSYTWTVSMGTRLMTTQMKIYLMCGIPNVGLWDDFSDDYFTVNPKVPFDACIDVPGNQPSGPCADQQCIQDGGTWNGSSCVFPTLPACSDGVDNDGDEAIDFPADNGCSSANDTTETPSGGSGGGGGGGGGPASALAPGFGTVIITNEQLERHRQE